MIRLYEVCTCNLRIGYSSEHFHGRFYRVETVWWLKRPKERTPPGRVLCERVENGASERREDGTGKMDGRRRIVGRAST